MPTSQAFRAFSFFSYRLNVPKVIKNCLFNRLFSESANFSTLFVRKPLVVSVDFDSCFSARSCVAVLNKQFSLEYFSILT